MKEIYVEIITPSKVGYKGEVKSITVPGMLGNFQVLFNHAPLMSTFDIGVIRIVDMKENTMNFTTSGGTVEVLSNKILLLAESFESPDEIDIKRAEESKKRAEERLKNLYNESLDFTRVEASLQRAINRTKLAQTKS
ncbi:MAG: ATP synthase F1 subunit epsilon [Ignavibacteria bacterium RBG_13_36_8]|nr:MAG: ATP synthase F1 subunit epsilon [Ignavibacteria bacterium RBG_13_36_8]